MMFGAPRRISRRLWTRLGGCHNSELFRRMRRGAWHYFKV